MIEVSPATPFANAFSTRLAHGQIKGIHLPNLSIEVPEEILSVLHPVEREIAQTLTGNRHVQFVGGRVALSQLFTHYGLPREPVAIDVHGAPVLPHGWVGSVSHTRDLAIAIMARGDYGVGIDVEGTIRPRPGVEEKILCGDELDDLKSLPENQWWLNTVIRFSIKEALYKAVHRFVGRYIGFREFAIWPEPSGEAVVEPLFAEAEAFTFDARYISLAKHIIATAIARPR